MKLSNEKTNHVIIKAYTKDDYIEVDFAIIELDEEFISSVKEMEGMMKKIKRINSSACCLEIFSYVPFYVGGGISEEISEFLQSDKYWSFIEITDEEIDKLTEVDDRLSYGMYKVYGDDSVIFMATGKYSEVEYCTNEFLISKL